MILTMLLLSDSFSRRYTPLTCTLEINAQTSALSRWSRQPVLKQLQFHLSFDNLLHSDNQPIQVSGDRTQLDALCDVVESYVQTLLNQLPTNWQPAQPETPPVVDQPDRFESTASQDGTARVTGAMASMPESFETQGIYLKPKNRLSHNLFLGSLMTETSGPVVNLSTSQLFDLASALEEYAAELIALPNLEQQSSVQGAGQSPIAWVRGTPLWAQTAAVAVVAVGITTAALQLANNSNPISQRPNEPISSLPSPGPGNAPIPPPPPPPGSTPLPSDLSTVPLPSTLPNPSDLPNIEPPPDSSTSSGQTTSKSESKSAAKKTTSPLAIPSAGNQIIAIQPKYPTVSQTMAARKAAAKSKASGTTSYSTFGTTSSSTSQSQSSQAKETAFDAIPQVAEVRSYFKKTWLPPKGLKQSLQYTLILNPNGSIDRALPRGQAADTYLDRTPIPLANEPFFTPIKSGSRPKVRLVLSPDGSVKTFLESSN